MEMRMIHHSNKGTGLGPQVFIPYLIMGFLLIALIVGIVALVRVAGMLMRDTVQEVSNSTALQMLPDPTIIPQASDPQETARQEETIIESNPHFIQGEEEDWRLILVNPWNPYDGEAPELTYLRNEQSIDSRCYEDLQEMMDDCRAQGLEPLICSSYRTLEKQQELYNTKVNTLVAQGHTLEEAQEEAKHHVAEPGTSEHHLGLAVDIVDMDSQMLEEVQAGTDVAEWLMAHCHEYGFILRYPEDKCDSTGVIYEPWHYRYVGREAAKEIVDSGLCLEEYLQMRQET